MTSTATTALDAQRRTRAFARVIGPYVAVFTTIYAIRLPSLQGLTTELFADPVPVLMLGALMLGAGLVIIGLHRNWRGPLAVTISLFGWFVAIRGFLLIAVPDTLSSAVDATMLSPTGLLVARVFFGCLAVMGLTLTYAGWRR
ncbi:hypothetical protein [Amycolatopsis albispora]|uniref:Uncharacterized protein n=1 Tax=Amycolatopsis albispora TaxID=1804986 RepID=A0A344LIM2_9PSEU|nr:hypothetical protein [Amycolatopsis albispora]AXB47896.1 hypothetical protein A4R43_40115 [Amycolatopsis albispora]